LWSTYIKFRRSIIFIILTSVLNHIFTIFLKGDSGGPIERLSDGILVGIASFGGGDCDTFPAPLVMARVAYARKWIKEITNI
jgi:hypothetical protein